MGKNALETFNLSIIVTAYKNLVLYMSENIDQNCSVSDIARNNFVSVSYMKFLFSKYAGLSPKKYFMDLRVQRANELLCQGLSVSQVAQKMNFSSDNYFSSFYKKQTGIQPKKFTRFA
jgi:AraC-like DNA-binding protein